MNRRRASQAAIFLILLLMSLSMPLMIEAIFPGGRSEAAPPPEIALAPDQPATAGQEARQVRENYAWLRGDSGSVLDAGDGIDDEVAAAEEAALAAEEEGEAADAEGALLDLRPGAFIGYDRSWDNLDIRRESFRAGAFVFISSHTRLTATGARLRFRDETDRISGESVRLDGAHRLPGAWLLEEGVEHDDYDHRHDSWNGDVRLSGAVAPRVGIALEGGRRDVWERLSNIQDKLRLWQVGLSIFYELLPRWWLAGIANAGWYSDRNARLLTGAELGFLVAPRAGLSVAAGIESTSFKEQEITYWSPSYYHYVYGRIRLTRGHETAPFERRRTLSTWGDRLGYLAEVTAGVNEDGFAETSERLGVTVRATDRLTFRAEGFHLDSAGRFDTTYGENRADVSAEVRF